MKKIISLILVVASLLLLLTGCNFKFYKDDYALMIGVHTSQSGKEVANTVAAIVIDKDYKIVSCRIDTIAVTAELTEDGKINAEKTYKSKAELGDDYGMLTNSPYYGSSLAEWYDQAKAFENFVIGKTQDEVNGIAVKDDGKTSDEALSAGCTIAITDFISAVNKAFDSKQMVGLQTKKEISALGVAVNADVKSSGNSGASYTADFAAVVFVDGKIIAAVIDSNEVTCTVKDGKFGQITDKGTKLEQGNSYGMVAYGGAIAEWYEQAQAFADTAIGKTKDEVASLAIEGIAGCTMYAGGYKAVLEKAANYAR